MKTILFRYHRGGLVESMKTVREIRSYDELHLKDMLIERYYYDSRIDWNTYIVTAVDETNRRYVVGFTNGVLDEFNI